MICIRFSVVLGKFVFFYNGNDSNLNVTVFNILAAVLQFFSD